MEYYYGLFEVLVRFIPLLLCSSSTNLMKFLLCVLLYFPGGFFTPGPHLLPLPSPLFSHPCYFHHFSFSIFVSQVGAGQLLPLLGFTSSSASVSCIIAPSWCVFHTDTSSHLPVPLGHQDSISFPNDSIPDWCPW